MAKAENPLGLAPYDPADYLRTPKEVAMYLEAFFEDGVDHEALVHALGVVARARGESAPARCKPPSKEFYKRFLATISERFEENAR
jgi:probable addiction module antidote protein